MAFTNICTSRICGHFIENADIGASAAIALTKLGTRVLRLPVHLLQNTGAIINKGVFPAVTFDEATQKYSRAFMPFPNNYASGNIAINIYWNTAATAGNVKWTVDIKSTPAGGATSSENAQNVTTAVSVGANNIVKSSVTFASTLFAAGDIIGIQITRDGGDAADTCAQDIFLLEVDFEYTARG